jgi:hypothetical protein
LIAEQLLKIFVYDFLPRDETPVAVAGQRKKDMFGKASAT